MKVLLAEDDDQVANIATITLQRGGYEVVRAYDGGETLRRWCAEDPDLIILDIQMPVLDGFTVCRKIRSASDVPIIMLTARNEDTDVIHGLEIGADDYVPKPFSPKQLLARVQAVLRRSKDIKGDRFALGSLHLDLNRQALVGDDALVRLTSLEFRFLHYLLTNRGQIIPTNTLLSHVWGSASGTDRAMLKQLVYRLRQKIEPNAQELIETIPGVGYTIAT